MTGPAPPTPQLTPSAPRSRSDRLAVTEKAFEKASARCTYGETEAQESKVGEILAFDLLACVLG